MSTDSFQYRDPLPSTLPLDSLPELTDQRNEDGKSLVNPPRSSLLPSCSTFQTTTKVKEELSEWYEGYPEEIDSSNNAFDFHIYYSTLSQLAHARKLHQRIRYEFPELRVYKFWEEPIGPHPSPMFEVNTFTPIQFGAFFGFLTAYRGDLSVLVHPNTDDELADHTTKATWMGDKLELKTDSLKPQARFGTALTTPASA
ncbi:DOPA 4,5-dioxygenase family protein [Sporobolomyces salmoneus]|uniref:DOPA 4,5-dioxygenase family protein n=1 Tax=Sporobolomyces salmoneus TaxID=183962 RepID=UPI003175912C